jgi:hypothetical protein
LGFSAAENVWRLYNEAINIADLVAVDALDKSLLERA